MTEVDPRDLERWRAADRVLDELLARRQAEELPPLESLGLEPAVLEEVRRLLAAADSENSPLDRPAAELLTAIDPEEAQPPLIGHRCGPWLVEAEVGRGGMSMVYRARRSDGEYDQAVALKVLTLAQLVGGSLPRFRRERDILARLRHSGIAALVDGGALADGTPWLAMELVDGEPIDAYCSRLTEARDVVKLFLQVCDAVAFAHLHLIVHRDLKPGNILVDRAGRARLLDFGIARLLDDVAPDATSTRVFTPLYAAPEQLRGEPVTTATDVYGLGRVLQHLLARRPPSGPGPAWDPEPEAAEGDGLPALRGFDRDLDRVIQMAMRPEPERRYPGAAELGEDLRRWLELRPVQAAPDSLAYRLRKLAARRRGAVAAGLLVLAATAAGVSATLWQAHRARIQAEEAQREATRANAVSDYLVELFRSADPFQTGGRDVSARELLDRGAEELSRTLAGEPATRADILRILGWVYGNLGAYERAAKMLEESLALADSLPEREPHTEVAALEHLAHVRIEQRRLVDADRALDRATPVAESLGGRAEATLLHNRMNLRAVQGRRGEAEAAGRQALARWEELEPEGLGLARTAANLGTVLIEAGRPQEAVPLLKRSLHIFEAHWAPDHPEVATTLTNLGSALQEMGRLGEAEAMNRRALEALEARLGESHPTVAVAHNMLAVTLGLEGRYDEAETEYRRALAIAEAMLGADHPTTAIFLGNLAEVRQQQGDAAGAKELFERSLAIIRTTLGADHSSMADKLRGLAAAERDLGHLERAESLLLEAIAVREHSDGPEHPDVGRSLVRLGELYAAEGRRDEAAATFGRARTILAAALGAESPEVKAVEALLAEQR